MKNVIPLFLIVLLLSPTDILFLKDCCCSEDDDHGYGEDCGSYGEDSLFNYPVADEFTPKQMTRGDNTTGKTGKYKN
jgi:hypothetical protein